MSEEVRAAAERLRTLHRRYEDSDGGDDQPIAYFTACEQDEQDWPCDTIRALDALVAGHEAGSMNPEVRMAAERLLARAESCTPDVPWTNVSVPKSDVLAVARAALASSHEAGGVERLMAAGDLMAKRLIQLESRHWRTEGLGPDRWQCLLCGQRSGDSSGSHTTDCPVHIWQSERAALAAAPGASDGAGEATRLRERLRIATNALGAIADGGGECWHVADDALTQMSVVDHSSGAPDGAGKSALHPDELSTIQEEIKRRGRCSRCDHLFVFHHYAGGSDQCQVNTCSCEL